MRAFTLVLGKPRKTKENWNYGDSHKTFQGRQKGSKPCGKLRIMVSGLSVAQRFRIKVLQGARDECWPWLGAHKHGYGLFSVTSKEQYMAHRYAFFLAYGCFPKLTGSHTCHRRDCCNPEHVVDESIGDNIRRSVRAGRYGGDKHWTRRYPELAKAVRRKTAKLTFAKAEEVRRVYRENTFTQQEVGSLFGISEHAVYLVVHNKLYAKG